MVQQSIELPAEQRNDGECPFVSVIIPVFNDCERLEQCLQALYAQSYPANCCEIIVVDNGSRVPIQPRLVSKFPLVRIGVELKPGSYSARNLGIQMAKGEVLAFTDSDCVPHSDWLRLGVKRLLSVERCGLVAGKIELTFRDPQHPTAAELYEKVVAFPQHDYVSKSHYGATANVFTYSSVMQVVGPFDGNLTSGGDAEWGRRVHGAGYQQVYGDDTVVYHPARGSMWSLLAKRCRTAGGNYFLQKKAEEQLGLPWWRKVVRVVRRHLIPNRKDLLHLWNDPRLENTGQRTKVVAVGYLLNVGHAIEFVRIYFGGRPWR
ncbi:glycosyltransferase [Blastopirellula marina]|uniref:Glycosyl transferase family 2 n=1 Tax=Blastopirellula marina TaxID=124 RepID=A0A2S8G0U7_9BACT|nr:glycosyltransferase [Blastopirellula marina]PQO38075.1 glycosyl transferase family 2 [Blastopirellula marina]PTL44731.1 glycosyl transferase family 2 [Blastopirellula marina]